MSEKIIEKYLRSHRYKKCQNQKTEIISDSILAKRVPCVPPFSKYDIHKLHVRMIIDARLSLV